MIGVVVGALLAAMLAMPVLAQQTDEGPRISFEKAPPGPSEPRSLDPEPVKPASRSIEGESARLRMLDKMNGQVETFDVAVGETVQKKRLIITLRTCRTPPTDEKEDAYAFLQIRDEREDYDRFDGWMLASSPALSALDHARYDVWVLSCSTVSGEASEASAQKSE
jgi:hypothetical protein